MAVMWPRKLPAEVLRNELRSAERKVYDRLAAELDDSWMVFYSRPWLGLASTGEEIDGECDFVLARADSGFLALEVKGGGISYDPVADSWTSRDRWGFRHTIKNPVGQARSSKHQLLRKLKSRPSLASRRLRAVHGVVFPDADRPGAALGPDMPLHLFCFRLDFEGSLRQWLEERLGTPDASTGETPLGRDGMAALEDLLAHPFQLKLALGHIIREDDQALQVLTPGQFRILTALEGVRRAAVAGGAGTGKTILAIEKARRCAAEGMRTLLTCFNRPLADYISELVGGVAGIDVMTFQAACRRTAEAAGLEVPRGQLDQETLASTFPELLMEAVQQRPDLQYDAVIVDEGQDFPAYWWPAVDALLHPSGRGLLYVFYDANQRVYPEVPALPKEVGLIPIRLVENLRNTVRIHEACKPHYSGPETFPVGPEGVPVRWISVDGRGVGRTLDACVARCVGEDRILPREIGVIVSSQAVARDVAEGEAGTVSYGALWSSAGWRDHARHRAQIQGPRAAGDRGGAR